ncbi:unnamed protein product [Brachionus calyciflorus]|uniref:Uncharacterized protein n=1 Tax=Brachionus calyciflorus TaxID=104777 RepID=A0A813RGD6_9BILA|nr:unnamed protein product [Brachionus calyciflorus]
MTEGSVDSLKAQELVLTNKKTRGKNKSYYAFCSYRDFSTADSALKKKFDSQKWRKGNLKRGDKRYYSCVTKGTKSNCPVSLFLQMHNESRVCTVFMSNDEHDHQDKNSQADASRISLKVKNEIIRIYENETHKINLIIDMLNEKQLKATKVQVYNLINRYKIMKYGSKDPGQNNLKEYSFDCKKTEKLSTEFDK